MRTPVRGVLFGSTWPLAARRRRCLRRLLQAATSRRSACCCCTSTSLCAASCRTRAWTRTLPHVRRGCDVDGSIAAAVATPVAAPLLLRCSAAAVAAAGAAAAAAAMHTWYPPHHGSVCVETTFLQTISPHWRRQCAPLMLASRGWRQQWQQRRRSTRWSSSGGTLQHQPT